MLPDGADSVLRRRDGAMVIDVRLALKPEDGALVSTQYTELMYGRTLEAERALKHGSNVPQEPVYPRTMLRWIASIRMAERPR